jgi:signal transduction histidine kinase
MDILAKKLPDLGISSCYLALYENPQPYEFPQPAPEWSRLMLAYTEKGQIKLGSNGRRFRSHELLPEGLWPEGRQFSFVAVPLYFQKNQLGFALFEIGPCEATIYQALRGEISSALQGASLVQQEEKRTHQLQTVVEVSTATSTILDTADLLQQVVDLTKESFNLYHAHIYLLDETDETLVLAAGAGKVGQQMVTEEWNISLKQEQSIVTRAARTRQGYIVNNVQVDPYWLSNPLLPNTRAELAVPLMIGDQVLGVLDVQADEIDYFTQDDVHIQSALAAQIAVAIQNARLYHQETKRVQELAKLNADLKAAQDELIRQERLATVGQLTAIVSHEIRNPLATIRASAFTIDQKVRDKGLGVEPALERLERNITRCDNIIAEFLDFTRTPALKLQPVCLDKWLKQVLDKQALPESINLSLDLNVELEVPLDPERFRQVIVNLFDNACQAMQEKTNPDGQEHILHVQSSIVGERLKLSITDTGPGIPPDVLTYIFEPLYSTKGFGVGLGLSIVKEIVRQHDGEIEVNSKVGLGTQVVVWLPLD